MLFFAVAITFVAAVSYHFGGSMRGMNSDQQSIHTPITETEHSEPFQNNAVEATSREQITLSNTPLTASKQAEAIEAKTEPYIPNYQSKTDNQGVLTGADIKPPAPGYLTGPSQSNNRVTTTLPSLPKEEVFNIPAKQAAKQPIYDKHNWPPGANGYIYSEDGGCIWIYADTNKPKYSELTPQEFPVAIRLNGQERLRSEQTLNEQLPNEREHTDKKVKRKLIATQQRSIYRNAEPLVSQRNLSETSTKIGNFYFRNFTTSDGQTVNGNSTRIGNTDFHNFTTSDGQTINGSSTKIGNFDFHNFTTSDGRSINGTSTRIGNFTFNNFNDSAGNSINGTTTNLGNMSFSNYNH